MVLTDLEEIIIREIAKSNLLTKSEMSNIVNPRSDIAINSAIKSLMEKGLVASVNPIGSTCYVLTREGTRTLREIQ